MVSDTVLVGVAGVLGTALGASIGLLAEPVRSHFAKNAQQDQLRRVVYGELLIKFREISSIFWECENTVYQINYRALLNCQADTWESILFPDEVTAQAQYQQLTSKEIDKLSEAYGRLRKAIHNIDKFCSTHWSESNGRIPDLGAEIKIERLMFDVGMARNGVDFAFRAGKRFLEKIDKGFLCTRWKECSEGWKEKTDEHNKSRPQKHYDLMQGLGKLHDDFMKRQLNQIKKHVSEQFEADESGE